MTSRRNRRRFDAYTKAKAAGQQADQDRRIHSRPPREQRIAEHQEQNRLVKIMAAQKKRAELEEAYRLARQPGAKCSPTCGCGKRYDLTTRRFVD